MKSTNSERLYRYNLMIGDSESAWLDQLAEEIHTSSGAKVSRSEIIRAAIAGLRELHRLGPTTWIPALTSSQSGDDLKILSVLAARAATRERP